MDQITDTQPVMTALGHQREHLENARMAEFAFRPKTDNARALADLLTGLTLEHESQVKPRQRKRQPKAEEDFKGAVAAFAAELIYHGQFEEADGFFYRSSDRDQLAETLVSSRSFEHIRAFWPSMGLMEETGFFRAKETWEGEESHVFLGRARRFRATPSLLEIANGFGITPANLRNHFEREIGRICPVTIRSEERDSSGRKEKPRNLKASGPRFDWEVRRVAIINDILAKGGFDLKDRPRVYRLFNRGNDPDFSFDMGGRLYCRSDDNWQRMPKEQRARITCRGEPTVELDVRASHLFILYALHDMDLPSEDDPYSLPGIERSVVKGLFAAISGMGSYPTRWPRKMAEEYLKATGRSLSKRYRLKDVLEALRKKHPVLDRIRPYRMDWARLQYEESECFMLSLTRLGKQYGVAALPIHDSIIVADRYRDIAQHDLTDAY